MMKDNVSVVKLHSTSQLQSVHATQVCITSFLICLWTISLVEMASYRIWSH